MGATDETEVEAGVEAKSEAATESATRAANGILSNAADHLQHLDPRSGLPKSHIFPVIYTKYHFEDLKFGYLQYTK